MFAQRVEQVRARIAQLITSANQRYQIVLPHIDVRFDLEGRAAGQAGIKKGQYFLRFNRTMMQNEGWDHLYNDTVPHELAHLVCFYQKWDRGHGRNWQSVCRALGGTGQRCHSEMVEYARGETYYYTTTTNRVVALSSILHRKVQAGRQYRWRDGGRVSQQSPWTLTRPSADQQPQQVEEDRVAAQAPAAPQTLGKKSRSEQVREEIRMAKLRRADIDWHTAEEDIARHEQAHVTEWAVRTLGMTRSLARRYVTENWARA